MVRTDARPPSHGVVRARGPSTRCPLCLRPQSPAGHALGPRGPLLAAWSGRSVDRRCPHCGSGASPPAHVHRDRRDGAGPGHRCGHGGLRRVPDGRIEGPPRDRPATARPPLASHEVRRGCHAGAGGDRRTGRAESHSARRCRCGGLRRRGLPPDGGRTTPRPANVQRHGQLLPGSGSTARPWAPPPTRGQRGRRAPGDRDHP